MNTQILPQLNLDILQQKANEFAMQGAIKTLEEYYSGYNSPFRKAISNELDGREISTGSIALPDIIALINQRLSHEIDIIANNAVSKSFAPMVSKFLTRIEKHITFSQILKEFIRCNEIEDPYDASVEITKDSQYSWLNIRLQSSDREYKMAFHVAWDAATRKDTDKYHILSLPYGDSRHKQTMKLSISDATLELPFTPSVLEDSFLSYIARIIICRSEITMDCQDFDEDWFVDEDSCHCH